METKKTTTGYERESRRISGGFFRSRKIIIQGVCMTVAVIMAVIRFSFTYECVISLVTAAILIRIAVVDAWTMKIPDRYNCALLLPSAMSLILMDSPGIGQRLAGIFAVSVPMYLMIRLIPGSFGGGDVKLSAAGGLLLGVNGILLATFISILTGGCYAVGLLISGKAGRKSHFAFGPFLACGVWISMLYGTSIIGWYLSLF